LDAIRGFEKTKLHRAEERKVAKKKKRHDDVVDSAGHANAGGSDLMSDLAAQLKLRRKGISGAGKASAAGGNTGDSSGADSDSGRRIRNPLDRLSRLIPPPPPKPSEPRGSHDEDWADS
jgi:hypothetical protein